MLHVRLRCANVLRLRPQQRRSWRSSTRRASCALEYGNGAWTSKCRSQWTARHWTRCRVSKAATSFSHAVALLHTHLSDFLSATKHCAGVQQLEQICAARRVCARQRVTNAAATNKPLARARHASGCAVLASMPHHSAVQKIPPQGFSSVLPSSAKSSAKSCEVLA
jgi:hypothetical protein